MIQLCAESEQALHCCSVQGAKRRHEDHPALDLHATAQLNVDVPGKKQVSLADGGDPADQTQRRSQHQSGTKVAPAKSLHALACLENHLSL